MLNLQNTVAILQDDNGLGVVIEVSRYKDMILVKGSYGDYKFENKLLPSDIKYLPNLIDNAEAWEEFYEKCVNRTSFSEFQKCLRHVATKLKEIR